MDECHDTWNPFIRSWDLRRADFASPLPTDDRPDIPPDHNTPDATAPEAIQDVPLNARGLGAVGLPDWTQ